MKTRTNSNNLSEKNLHTRFRKDNQLFIIGVELYLNQQNYERSVIKII